MYQIIKMDTIEHGEECLLTTRCDDFGQTVLLIKKKARTWVKYIGT